MKGDRSRPRVLIVDDEETIRAVVGKALQAHGYGCKNAANGLEGLEKAREERPDLVLTDLKMPLLDGLQMIETIRREQPELPIIIMTAYGELDSARRAIQLGVVDYLIKPFDDLNKLVVATGRAIAERKERLKADAMTKELEERAESLERESTSLREELQEMKRALRKTLAEIGNTEIIADEHVAQVASLIAGQSDGLLITDTFGRVVAANSKLLKHLNAPSWKGTGASISRMPGESALREAMEELARSAAAGVETEAQTVEVIGTDGETVPYELSSAPVKDEDGTIIGALTRVVQL